MRILARPGKLEERILPATEFESAKCDYVVEVKAKPVGGEANRQIERLLSKRFGKGRIVSGATGKLKIFETIE